MDIGKRLKKIRLKRNLSLRELGKRAHISHSFIADIESGRSKPSIDTLKSLANALNVTISELTGEKDYIEDNVIKSQEIIAKAISDDPELLEFWQELIKRDDLQLLFKQVKDLDPDTIKRIIRYIKIVEDEEANM